MIHVKQPDNILPDKKKVNTKPSIKSNINQNYEYDEEGLDIFEDTKGITLVIIIYFLVFIITHIVDVLYSIVLYLITLKKKFLLLTIN